MVIGLAVVENDNLECGAKKLVRLLSNSAIILARVLIASPACAYFQKPHRTF